MLYLFLMSVIPTVPAAWLTFADGVVYSAYDRPARLFGISATDDQQMAGLTMKLLGGGFLWAIIIYLFFKWAADEERADRAKVRRVSSRPPQTSPQPSTVDDDLLTWDQVEHELQHLGPPPQER
jgi:putative membrane protein